MCCLCFIAETGKLCEKTWNVCSSRFKHSHTIAPFLHHQAVCGEGCLACESATVLSRQEGNNGFAVLLVHLAAFMQHFSERHRRLLALWAVLTRPLPAGHWPVVPTVPAARQASEGCRLSHSNWCLGSGWSKVPSWLWSPGNFPSSDALQSLPTCLFICLPACLSALFGQRGKGLMSAGFIMPAFLIRDDRAGLSFPCPFKKKQQKKKHSPLLN